MVDDKLLHFLERRNDYVHEYLRLVDVKAGATFLLCAGIFGALLERGVEQHFRGAGLLRWTSIGSFFFLGLAGLVAAMTVIPHFWSLSKGGLLFFGDISRIKSTDYLKRLRALDATAAEEEVTQNLIEISRVCYRKYNMFLASILLALAAGGLSLFCLFKCPKGAHEDVGPPSAVAERAR
jgi:hypothetical protein